MSNHQPSSGSQKKSQPGVFTNSLRSVMQCLLPLSGGAGQKQGIQEDIKTFFLLLWDLIHQHLMADGITCCQKPPSACCNELGVGNLSTIADQKLLHMKVFLSFPESTRRSRPDYGPFLHPGGLRVYSWVPKMML